MNIIFCIEEIKANSEEERKSWVYQKLRNFFNKQEEEFRKASIQSNELLEEYLRVEERGIALINNLSKEINQQEIENHQLSSKNNENEFNDVFALVNFLAKENSSKRLPLIEKKEFSNLTSSIEDSRDIDVNKVLKWFAEQVDTMSPLIEDEELLSQDFLGYLSEDFEGEKKGTPVIRRTTNLGTICYLMSDSTEELEVPEKSGSSIIQPNKFDKSNFGIEVSDLAADAIELSQGLLGLIPGGQIGALFLGFWFRRKESKFDVQQMLKAFSTIVEGANNEQTIREQLGSVKGVMAEIDDYYVPRVESGKFKKDEMYFWLGNKHSTIATVLGIMSQGHYEQRGLLTYEYAAMTSIAIRQAMAQMDTAVSNPQQSSLVQTIQQSARSYSSQIKDIRLKIINDFIDKMNSQLHKITHVSVIRYGRYFNKIKYEFKDKHTGYSYSSSSERGALERRREYYSSKYKETGDQIQQLRDKLAWVFTVANNLLRLADNPSTGLSSLPSASQQK